MRGWTDAQRAEYRAHVERAADRARAVLKPGDRIRVTRCGGGSPTFTFAGWYNKTTIYTNGMYDDISPVSIIAVNRKPTSFRDDPEGHLADPFGPAEAMLEPTP